MNTKNEITYIAKFTTGKITRITHRKYISSSAYVNQETGEIKNETFSSKIKSSPSVAGIFSTNNRRAYGSYKRYCKAMKRNEELRKIWKIETVEV